MSVLNSTALMESTLSCYLMAMAANLNSHSSNKSMAMVMKDIAGMPAMAFLMALLFGRWVIPKNRMGPIRWN